MPSLDPHVNTPPQLVMSLRSIYPSAHEHSKDPNVFVQVWLQGLVGTHSSLSIGNNNRTTWTNLIYSKTLHCNTRTFLDHFIILPIHVCWSNLFRRKPVGQKHCSTPSMTAQVPEQPPLPAQGWLAKVRTELLVMTSYSIVLCVLI